MAAEKNCLECACIQRTVHCNQFHSLDFLTLFFPVFTVTFISRVHCTRVLNSIQTHPLLLFHLWLPRLLFHGMFLVPNSMFSCRSFGVQHYRHFLFGKSLLIIERKSYKANFHINAAFLNCPYDDHCHPYHMRREI